MVSNLCQNSLHVVVCGVDFWLLRRRDLSGYGRGFSYLWKKNLQLNERRVGKFRFIDVRTVFRNRETLSSPSGESTDLSREPEFDSVYDAALSRSIRP